MTTGILVAQGVRHIVTVADPGVLDIAIMLDVGKTLARHLGATTRRPQDPRRQRFIEYTLLEITHRLYLLALLTSTGLRANLTVR
jgi:hypothetical protein